MAQGKWKETWAHSSSNARELSYFGGTNGIHDSLKRKLCSSAFRQNNCGALYQQMGAQDRNISCKLLMKSSFGQKFSFLPPILAIHLKGELNSLADLLSRKKISQTK